MTFSLLHPTKRLPEGWRPAWEEWNEKCDDLGECEYLLVLDLKDWKAWPTCFPWRLNHRPAIWMQVIMNQNRPCTADAWNVSAKAARGDVLVCVADDWFPCEHWDTRLKEVIPDLKGEYVIWVGANHCPGLIIHPILTRAYYERPGRGGMPNGELFYPDYISVGSDDDFTSYSHQDGVVIRAWDIQFEHRHPSAGIGELDATYNWSNRQEAWDRKEEVLARRHRDEFKK
jgi:hypothetical protein